MAKSDFAFCYPFKVRYSEIDAQRIVFNAHYLTYYDTAITEYMIATRFDHRAFMRSIGAEFHTVRAVVEWKAPIYFEDEIEVWTRAARIGRSSLTFLLEIHPKGKDDLRATGEVVWVCTVQQPRTPAAVPPELIGALQRIEGERLTIGQPA
jgi:acyl-CoA thioester hydrolase